MALFQSLSNGEMVRMLEEERRQTEQLVDQLSQQAAREQRKVIEGMVAVPAAVSLSMAAMTLRVVAFTARAFDVIRRVSVEAQREAERRERERPEAARPPEQPRA